MNILILLLLFQDSTTTEGGTRLPIPTISIEHSAEYFAAKATVGALAAQYEKAQADLDSARTKVIADCGEAALPNEGVAGKMVCIAKPAPKPEAVKPEPAKP